MLCGCLLLRFIVRDATFAALKSLVQIPPEKAFAEGAEEEDCQ